MDATEEPWIFGRVSVLRRIVVMPLGMAPEGLVKIGRPAPLNFNLHINLGRRRPGFFHAENRKNRETNSSVHFFDLVAFVVLSTSLPQKIVSHAKTTVFYDPKYQPDKK